MRLSRDAPSSDEGTEAFKRLCLLQTSLQICGEQLRVQRPEPTRLIGSGLALKDAFGHLSPSEVLSPGASLYPGQPLAGGD